MLAALEKNRCKKALAKAGVALPNFPIDLVNFRAIFLCSLIFRLA
jgi:hypothetical protein